MSKVKEEKQVIKQDDELQKDKTSLIRLSKKELAFYIFIEAATFLYLAYCIYWESIDRSPWMTSTLSDHVSWLGRKIDIADKEWHLWRETLLYRLPFYIIYILLERMFKNFNPEQRKIGYMIFTMVYIVIMIDYKILVLFLAEGCIMYFTTYFGNVATVWATCIVLLKIVTSHGFIRAFITDNNKNILCSFIMLEFAKLTMMCTSFCLEKINSESVSSETKESSKDSENENETEQSTKQTSESGNTATKEEIKPCEYFSLMDLMQYIFYFPLLHLAPIVTYNTFRIQINQPKTPWTKKRIFNSVLAFLRIAFWAVFVDVCLHYFYVTGFTKHKRLFYRITRWTMMGMAFFHGQLMVIKRLVYYGFAQWLANLDGVETPALPRCLFPIYRFSDIWRTFDRGIYEFNKRYIYIPLGGSRKGHLKHVLALFVCFLVICNYLGISEGAIKLIVFCVIELVLEKYVGLVAQTKLFRKLEKPFTPVWRRRLRVMSYVPLYLLGWFASAGVAASVQTQNIIVRRMVRNGDRYTTFLLCFIVYCCFQIAIQIESRTKTPKTKTE